MAAEKAGRPVPDAGTYRRPLSRPRAVAGLSPTHTPSQPQSAATARASVAALADAWIAGRGHDINVVFERWLQHRYRHLEAGGAHRELSVGAGWTDHPAVPAGSRNGGRRFWHLLRRGAQPGPRRPVAAASSIGRTGRHSRFQRLRLRTDAARVGDRSRGRRALPDSEVHARDLPSGKEVSRRRQEGRCVATTARGPSALRSAQPRSPGTWPPDAGGRTGRRHHRKHHVDSGEGRRIRTRHGRAVVGDPTKGRRVPAARRPASRGRHARPSPSPKRASWPGDCTTFTNWPCGRSGCSGSEYRRHSASVSATCSTQMANTAC
jgi:hypothetical protein